MTDIKPGQAWEVYSDREGLWKRAIVTDIKRDQVLLHYEGLLDFIIIPIVDLEEKGELYRAAAPKPPGC